MDRAEVERLIAARLEPVNTKIRQLQGALQGRRLLGPFVVSPAAMAAGAASGPHVVNHNAGTTDYVVLIEHQDVAFGYDVQYIVTAHGANSLTIHFRNVGPSAGADVNAVIFLLAMPA